MTTYTCTIDTPLGAITASANEDAITGLWFIGQKYYPAGVEGWIEAPDHAAFHALRAWLAAYFAGERRLPALKLAPAGTPFQKAVWDILLQIPLGKLTTYGAIAGKLADARGAASMSAQAVGGAVGHNPISLVIPCHRVIGANGSLTGYAGGLEKKKALLVLEGALF